MIVRPMATPLAFCDDVFAFLKVCYLRIFLRLNRLCWQRSAAVLGTVEFSDAAMKAIGVLSRLATLAECGESCAQHSRRPLQDSLRYDNIILSA